MPTAFSGAAHYKPPFPWFGGKSRVADIVWSALGDVPNYVEPFFGSGAVFFSRPHDHGVATLNDADGFVANFWRAVQADPEAVARWADNPVFECDLHARHAWLLARKTDLRERLEGDPDYFDAKIAGWWCWGLCCWIGGGWCAGGGPWHVVDGKLVDTREPGGMKRQLPHLNAGQGVNRTRQDLTAYFAGIADRLAGARVCCGDWSRICGPSPTITLGLTGVFLDPPYSHALRDAELYATETDCAPAVLEWCRANGANPLFRIVLAGYAGEHDTLESLGWRCHAWSAHGGYARQGDQRGKTNMHKERLWFSPHCLTPADSKRTLSLFAEAHA